YAWIFIVCDIISILVQAVGACITAWGNVVKFRNDLMIVGLFTQVLVILFFAILAGEYAYRAHKFRARLDTATRELRHSLKLLRFIFAVSLSFTCIMIRCTSRVAEMSRGWANPLMRNQTDFIVLGSA
ncbi:hypothetical protein BJ878DRAFT_558376, partial [Calycina marina]